MMYQGNALVRPSILLLRRLCHKIIGKPIVYSTIQRRLIYICAANNIKRMTKKVGDIV